MAAVGLVRTVVLGTASPTWEDSLVLRWTTAGESHGRALVAVVEGMVAGVRISSADIAGQLARRRLGYGRGARMKFEQDEVTVLAGVRHGSTLGGPIAIEIGNSEWPKWETVMAADPVDAAVLDSAGGARNAPLTRPRPGHADYAGMLKYRVRRCASGARTRQRPETAARVAAEPSPAHFCSRYSASTWCRMWSRSARRCRRPAADVRGSSRHR